MPDKYFLYIIKYVSHIKMKLKINLKLYVKYIKCYDIKYVSG